MTTYRNIHGRSIQSLATDPTESVAEGQIWYNTTSDTFKSIVVSAAWSSSGNLNTGRDALGGAGLTQTAALVFGGGNPPTKTSISESYNGTGWTNISSLNTARKQLAGTGSQTAALGAGGYLQPGGSSAVEQYDGSSWTSITSLPAARMSTTMVGTTTATLIFGGDLFPTPTRFANTSVAFNGSSWTAGGTMNTARRNLSAAGTQTAALGFAGYSPPLSSATESYNGTSWTSLNPINTARQQATGFGIQTAAIIAGGSTGSDTSATESWDGTSWTTNSNSMATARAALANNGAGTAAAGVVAGGSPNSTSTEEYNKSINFITSAAWSSGGTLNQTRGSLSGSSGAGTETAGVITTGNLTSTSVSSNTEEYDGTSWTEVTNYPTGTQWLTGLGTQTAALFMGGQQGTNSSGGSDTTLVTEYDGSSFSTGGALGTARRILAACGTQTAAIASNGSPRTNVSQSYDGSSWTTTPSTNATAEGRGSAASASSTAALVFGGSDPSPGKEVEEYNGSSWSEQNNLIDDRRYLSGFGTQTNALGCAGYDQEATTNLGTCVRYDGTSWSTDQSLSGVTRSQYGALSGAPSTAGVVTGGYSTTRLNITEEYNAETSTLNVKTLTQS